MRIHEQFLEETTTTSFQILIYSYSK
jgi:hypothetical protein